MKNIKINSTFYKDGIFDIKFPVKAYEAVINGDRIIVGFDSGDLEEFYPDSEFWRAVWCFDKTGKVLWKVESPYYISSETGEKVYYPCVEDDRCTDSVSSVVYNEKRNVLLAGARMIYKLDPETGKLVEIDHTER